MSVVDRFRPSWTGPARQRGRDVLVRLGRLAFGDRVGFALFLGTVCFAGFYWRIGVFITDNATLGNALVALSEGHLWIEDARYGSLTSPGMHLVDGRLYARNYGQIVAALPVLWGLRGLSLVVDVGVLLGAVWSLAFLALAVQVGRLLDRPRQLAIGGSAVAVGWFLLNLSVGRPIEPSQFPLIALDTGSLLAVAFAGVVLYRLLAREYDRPVGLAAATLAVAATPLGFWATIPKRHAFTAAATVGVMYALYRSRNPATDGVLSATGFRALAYAQVGLFTWIHAPEGFVLFVALVAADLPTAPSNDRRSLAVVAGVFLASLLPFLLTNALISGNPLRIPRMLPSYGGGEQIDLVSGGASGGGGTGTGDALLPPLLAVPLNEGIGLFTIVLDLFAGGAAEIARRPGGLYRVFVRAGPVDSWLVEDQAIYLSVFESAPAVAGVAAFLGSTAVAGARWGSGTGAVASGLRASPRRIPAAVGAGRRRAGAFVSRLAPRHAVDAFAVLVVVGFALIYVPRLPVHAQVTVRYLLVVYPLGVYGIARHAGLRRAVSGHSRLALWSWAGGVFIGVQLLFVAVVGLGFTRGEAFQLHAVLGLALAVPLAVLAVTSALTDRADRLIALAGGVAAALGTDFLLLSGLVYFQYGQYALPAVESLARLLSVV